MLLSGLAIDDNDPLARRDEGLEFPDVTSQFETRKNQALQLSASEVDEVCIANTGPVAVDTNLLIVVQALPANVSRKNASGGQPYIRVFLKNGLMEPDASIGQQFIFTGQSGSAPLTYSLQFLSGQGKP